MRPALNPDSLKNGEIVAAWVEGKGTTLKHFYRNGNEISLIASNPGYLQITVDTKECRVEVQGILLWVLREHG
jgi:repressor LexA